MTSNEEQKDVEAVRQGSMFPFLGTLSRTFPFLGTLSTGGKLAHRCLLGVHGSKED